MIRAIAVEWAKVRSLPLLWAVAIAAAFAPAVLAFLAASASTAAARDAIPLESRGFEVAGFGQPLVILFAALVVGSEYSGGQLRTTLLADPRRTRVFAAKLMLTGGCVAVIAAVAVLSSVAVSRVVVAGGLSHAPFTAGTWLNVGGVVINYVMMAVLAFAVTFLARTPIVAVIVLVPMVLGLTVSLVGAVPILRFLPDLAGMQLLLEYPGVGLLDPLPGALVMLAWAGAATVVAGVVFHRRDIGG